MIYYFIIKGNFASCVYCFVWSFDFFCVSVFLFLLNLVIWFVLCWVCDSTWRVMCMCIGKDGSLVMENLLNLCLGLKIIHIFGTSLISFDEFCSSYRMRIGGWKVGISRFIWFFFVIDRICIILSTWAFQMGFCPSFSNLPVVNVSVCRCSLEIDKNKL